MSKIIAALLCGLLFGFGLALSQMINPAKVIDFLDITGNWDPSLALVMAGALGIALPGFKLALKRRQPLLDDAFHVTHKTKPDYPLLIGAGIFGIGWGLSGYCPGPAVASLGLGNWEAVTMVTGIYAGFFSHRFFIGTRH